MTSRREFLNLAMKGSALTAAAALMPDGPLAARNANEKEATNAAQNAANASPQGHYKPPFKFGMGGVPLGNEFSIVTEEDANAILEAAWAAGVRYYDVSPWYGLGLAERRFGYFLHNKKRNDYIISSKVGKLLKASKTARNRDLFPFSPSPNDVVFDYTAPGIRRSIEDSLQRLGSTASILRSSMTSRLTINCYRPPGKNSSRLRRQEHFLSSLACAKRASSRAGDWA